MRSLHLVTTPFQSHRRAGALAIALALPLLMSACGKGADTAKGPPGGAMPPPEVNVVTVQPKSIALGYEYVGQTAGSRETEVRARVGGILGERR